MKNGKCQDSLFISFIFKTTRSNILVLPDIESYGFDERILDMERPFCVITPAKYLFTLMKDTSYTEYESFFRDSKKYRSSPYQLGAHYNTKLSKIKKQDKGDGYYILMPILKL